MKKVSICIPTLGRPEKLERLLESIEKNAGYPNYEILVGEDKMPPNNIGVPKMLKSLVEKSVGDFVIYLGNDCIMEKDCLKIAMEAMMEEFEDQDGLIGLNDQYWHGEFYTHWLASKKLLPYLGGEFFCTEYFHTGVDNELTERCRKIGKAVWCEEAKIIHDHPVNNGFKDIDDVYQLAYKSERMEHDRNLLLKRAELLGFDLHHAFGAPRKRPMVSDVLKLENILPSDYKNMRVLNVGIGSMTSSLASQLPFIRFKKLTHVETHLPYIEKARKEIWDSPVDYIYDDIVNFNDYGNYDLVLFFDVLEHLNLHDAIRIIHKIKQAGVKMLAFTPIERELSLFREGTDNIPSQEHKSLWTCNMFENLGFKVNNLNNFHGNQVDAVFASYYDIIPKKIFSIWLNKDGVNENIQKSINTHKIAGFDHTLITLDNCSRESKYVEKCLSRNDVKGWVKASDFLRLWYLYNYGGVYVDADTYILKDFDNNLMNAKLFCCMESNGYVANGIIGAVKGHPLLKTVMDIMEELDGSDDFVFEYGMKIWTKELDKYGENQWNKKNNITQFDNNIIYPSEYFLPYDHQTGLTNITSNSYTLHSYDRSWVD